MDVSFLGGLQVRVGGRLASFGGPQAQTVFALLAVDAGGTVTTSTLVDELWPLDPPRAAFNTVQTHVAAIRRGLGADRGRLLTRGRGYELELRPDELDTTRFEALVRRGRELLERDPSGACGPLEAALTLWAGEPLLGLTDRAPRLAIEASRLSELHLATLEDLADAHLRVGTTPTVLTDLERAMVTDPFRERTVALLLRSLAAADRRAEALSRYEVFRRRLAEELGLDPSEALQRLHRGLLGTATPRAGIDVRPPSQEQERTGALPAFHTRWFGREHDLDRVAELLETERLVTLVGPGGCGKTRTAVALARRVGPVHRSDVRFVDLAPARAGELVERTTARALGVVLDPHDRSVHEQLVRHVDGARTLVVLDNCEHLVDAAAAHVRALLADCPTVTVLATSREPLAIDGERVWRLGGLELPELGGTLEAAAVELLLDRGRAVRHDLVVDGADHDAVATVCRRLDGLPLAIELVASHLAYRSPGELARHLADHDRGTLLRSSRRGPRHRSLDTTIDWSYQLLDGREQQLLRALSVFVGGADLPAVVAVAGDGRDDLDVLQRLGSLVARSLVTITEVAGRTRYGLLETIREFAARRLHDAGEQTQVRSAHRDHYLARVESLPWDHRMLSVRAGEQLEPELHNLRAAIDTSVAVGDPTDAARLAFGAPRLVITGSHWDEYDRWLTRLWATSPHRLTFAALLERASRPEHVAAAAWMEGWRWARPVDEIDAALPVLQRAAGELPHSEPTRTFLAFLVAIGRWHVTADATEGLDRMLEVADGATRQGAELLRAAALDNAGLFQLLAGRYDDAVRTLEPCAVPAVWEHDAKPLLTLGFAQHLAGAHDAAVRTMRTNAEVVTQPAARFLTLLALGLAVAGAGDLGGARELIVHARDEVERPRWHHPGELVDVLVVLGACAAVEGRADRAVRLLAAAGPPGATTFRPMTAIHLHYLQKVGAGRLLDAQTVGVDGFVDSPSSADPGSRAEDDLGSLIDEELLRWARSTPPLATSGPGGAPWTSSSG